MSKLNIDQKTIFGLFDDKKADFLIPDYQRPYAWEDTECQTLWEDIFNFAFLDNDYSKFSSDNDEYFLDPINLGNPEEISIKKLAKLIIKLTHSSSKFKYCELPADDPIRRKPDITKANRELKWKPKVGIEDGVKKYIDFIQNNL